MAGRLCTAFLVLAARAFAQDISTACCLALSSAQSLAGKVYLPDTTQYDYAMGDYWSVSAALDPWCIAQPTQTQDVSDMLALLVANSCTFGIKGGGHGSWNGSNSVARGVTIDFAFMNTTTYDASTKIASVTPGAHWQSVYETLSPLGVTVAGGRAGTVGVGGFLSGGGNSFFAASHGMGCDTVQNFEVVLADGSIVNANAAENADLWVALKGGSGNFGLVTRFDLYAIEFPDAASPTIWGGLVQYDLAAGEQLLQAMVEFNKNVPSDLNTSAIMYWAYISEYGGMVLNVALDNTVGTVNPPAADVFLNVSNINSQMLRVTDLTTVTTELGIGQPSGYRNIWFTLLLPNDADVMAYAVAAHESAVAQLKAVLTADSGMLTLCMFQPINNVVAQHGVAKGGNVMGLDAALDGENGVMLLMTVALDGAANEANAMPIMQNWTDAVQRYAEASGSSFGWHYLNYAYKNQDPLGAGSAGSAAVAKMRAAAAKYDPNGVFQKLRASGFKIPAS